MRAVYVIEDGASIRRNGERLQVFVKGSPKEDIRLQHVEQLVLMGNIVVTPAALELLLDRGIDTVFLSHSGRYRGRLVSGISHHIFLRLAQYDSLTKESHRARLAKACVLGKLHNSRVFLQRFVRRHEADEAIMQAAVSLKAGMIHLGRTDDMEIIRGIEGAGAAAYFGVFGRMIRSSDFEFNGRNRRPPKDPVNAMLSFGYTLLHNLVEGIIQVVGLDPYLGALHAPQTGRPSLACDLVEEFRAPIVDAMVLSLINRKIVKRADFEMLGDDEPVRMKREVIGILVRAFEKRLQQTSGYGQNGLKLSLRDIVERQVRLCARFVLGRVETYEAFVLK